MSDTRYSYVLLAANGSTTNFSFDFPYLDKSHIHVSVDDQPVAFTWLSNYTIQVTPAPEGALEIRRITPKDSVPVDFNDGSTLIENDLDLLALFNLYCAQEAEDGYNDAVHFNSAGIWDGQGRTTTNFADPTTPTSLLTRNYFETIYLPPIQEQVEEATEQAQAAAASAASAAASAASAADSAEESEDNLTDFKNRYQGPHSSAPALRPDGTVLQPGDAYYDTTLGTIRVFSGAQWEAAVTNSVNGIAGSYRYIATAGQTAFGGVDEDGKTLLYDEFLDVYLNGVRLDSTDFTAVTGTSVTLASGAAAGDTLVVVCYGNYVLADANRYNYLIGITPGTAAGQKVFTGLNLSPGNVDVFYNGAKLLDGTDFTATDTTVTLTAAVVANDVLEIISMRAAVSVIDCGAY